MPTKNEILRQIEALRTSLAHCSCDDESPVIHGGEYFYIAAVGGLGQSISGGSASTNPAGFRTRQTAEAHQEAFAVFLALRTQKGVVPMEHGVWQYLIEGFGDGSRLEVRKRRDGGVKQSRCFSPAFETESQARDAIRAVGTDKIIKAMKTFAWA